MVTKGISRTDPRPLHPNSTWAQVIARAVSLGLEVSVHGGRGVLRRMGDPSVYLQLTHHDGVVVSVGTILLHTSDRLEALLFLNNLTRTISEVRARTQSVPSGDRGHLDWATLLEDARNLGLTVERWRINDENWGWRIGTKRFYTVSPNLARNYLQSYQAVILSAVGRAGYTVPNAG